MYKIAVIRGFNAAHRLDGYPGKCSRLHGHSWSVEAVFAGDELAGDGMLIDFEEAKAALEGVIERYDHSFLNEIEPFDSLSPTAENVAREIYMRLDSHTRSAFRDVRLESVTVWESEDTRATYGEN